MNNKITTMKLEELADVVDLYIRVSTLEQAEEGYSVEEQEAKLRAYCQAMGWRINQVCIDPGFSGATMDRPGLREVINDVQLGRCKKILVWKLDRLSRSQKDTLILLEDVFLANGCNFISLVESFDTSTPFGRCIVGILAAFAQMERENIKIRTMMGRQARVKKGYFHGSHAPVGYAFDDFGGLSIDHYYATIVREIFALFLSGKSICSIARAIEEKYGGDRYDWGNNTAIRRILSNPVYMGYVSLNGNVYKGQHAALVSDEDWQCVAARLERNQALDKRAYTYKLDRGRGDNLLTGLLFCGDCGARMYARKVSAKNKKYICHSVARTSARMIKSDNCRNRLHPYTVEELDNIVIEEIKKLSLDRAQFEHLADGLKDPVPAELEVMQERLAEIEKQIDRLLNLYQAGVLDLEELQPRVDGLKSERKKAQANVEELKARKPIMPRAAAWENITKMSYVLENGTPEEVHRIIHSLIDKVVVLNYDVTIYWSFV